jgi:hypothetical protein
MVSLPGATILAATAGSGAVPLAAGDHIHRSHTDHTVSLRHKESPIVAMRRIIETEEAARAATTTTTAPPPPATTVPVSPATTAAPPEVVVAAPPRPKVAKPPAPVNAAVAPKPAPKPSPPPAPVHSSGIVPPANPAVSIPANPPFESVCLAQGPMSPGCVADTLQATDNARAKEGLGPLALPGDYSALTAAEQLFVLSNSERVDRGLPPALGLVNEFDQDAQVAAQDDTDPSPSDVPPGVGVLRWGSNWGESAGALGSNYAWMYDDGPGSGNEACGAGGAGCWGHRDNILGFSQAQLSAAGGSLVMGAAEAGPPASAPWLSDTELFAVISGHPAYYVYTWAQAVESGAH